MIGSWDQWFIVVFGPLAMFMAMNKRWAKWSPIPGLIGQAGWFHATLVASQWGAFLTSFVYTAAWLYGVHQHWFATQEKK